MKSTKLIALLITTSISFSAISQKKDGESLDSLSFFSVSPFLETSPVISPEDAADDICIWVSDDPQKPIYIVGTDKKRGLETYNEKGLRIFDSPFGRINNVDLWDSPIGPIVAGTNRSYNSLDFYKLQSDGSLILLNRYPTGLQDVYGISFYKGPLSTEVFLSDKKGVVKRYNIKLIDQFVSINLLDQFKFSSTVEGIEGDAYYERVYIAEEDKGLWYIDLREQTNKRTKVLKTDKTHLIADLEGLALADLGNGEGYLFLSVQGNNTYAIVNRKTLKFEASFKIDANSQIDGAQETDGLEVSTHQRFQVLIVQDGHNDGESQNFKIIDLKNILDHLKQ